MQLLLRSNFWTLPSLTPSPPPLFYLSLSHICTHTPERTLTFAATRDCVSHKNTQLERSKRARLCAMKKRLTWILEVIISMQREQLWVSLYSPETCCAKALTLPKALLSPNGVETKETVKSVDTKPKRKRALAQLLAKTSSCCRSNWQAWLSTLTFFPALSHFVLFSFITLCLSFLGQQ